MHKIEWKKYIYKIVIVILVVFFVGGVGIGAENILSIEGVREIYNPEPPLSPMPETDEDMIQFINNAIEKALELCPETKMTASFTFDASTLKVTDDNAQILAAAKQALPAINSKVRESFTEKSVDYSVSASDFLSVCKVAASDITQVKLDYQYYKCSLCTSEIAYEDYGVECPECSSENTLQLRNYDKYKITVHIAPDSESFQNNPFPESAVVSAIISDNGSDVYALEDFSKHYEDAVIYAEINRLDDHISCLRFETTSSISAVLEMKGEYNVYGKITAEAKASDKVIYSFSWPELQLDKHEITVELGSSEVLKAKLNCDDPASYDVNWSSSDESVLSVDEKGYLKTNKVFGDSIITASFTFKGKVYSDSCLVHVGVPAEGVDLSRGKLSLKVGETATLSAVFNPKDSTNTKCYWYSEDESVATVDDNGNVTAAGSGSTVIYIITDYGNYYSSCKVEVTDDGR